MLQRGLRVHGARAGRSAARACAASACTIRRCVSTCVGPCWPGTCGCCMLCQVGDLRWHATNHACCAVPAHAWHCCGLSSLAGPLGGAMTSEFCPTLRRPLLKGQCSAACQSCCSHGREACIVQPPAQACGSGSARSACGGTATQAVCEHHGALPTCNGPLQPEPAAGMRPLPLTP